MPPRNANPPTGPRNARGPTRGGISKRKTGPQRVDKDGDLIMDASDAKSTGKGRPQGSSQPRGARGGGRPGTTSRGATPQARQVEGIIRGLSRQPGHANVLESRIASRREFINLRVRGLKESRAASNPDGGVKDLLSFLERKASGMESAPSRGVKIKKHQQNGDDIIITASEVDGDWILKLNTFKFAGATLKIERSDDVSISSTFKDGEKMSANAKATQDKIRAILSSRYDVSLKLLNLSALGKDPALIEMGMLDDRRRISKLFPVLMVVCDKLFTSAQQKRDAIVSVTLTDNELDSISQVTTLAQTFPDLQNLDLSRNNFSEIRQLDGWRLKFRKLQNLRILENPIELVPNYQQDLIKWYPNLQVLNDVQVRTPEDIEIALQAKKAVTASPIPIAGPDFRDVNGIGEEFIRKFFPLYDSDRVSLADSLYDEKSTLSVSVNTSAPRADDQAKVTAPWSSYIRQSRNLSKITTSHGRQSREYRGIKAIKGLWSDLPPTRHPDISTQTSKYLVDCHQIPGLPDPTGQNPRGVDGMVLMIHGEFEERPTGSTEIVSRSFSRTFVLGPGLPNGPAIRVISDIMVLRAWSPLASSVAEENSTSDEDSQRQEIASQLIQRTNLTLEYATMCLAEANWELEKGIVIFEANKEKLPVEAFINGTPLA